jgi:DNA-binding NarL/FixJ family response regulator
MLKTFIVEDSPVIRENLIATLEEMVPLQVVGHADHETGASAWLADPAHRCDLVIVDIFLRQGSGIGVLQRLRQLDHPADRVILTNYGSADLRRQCLALGADRVFDKSGDIDALIDHCLALAQARVRAATEGGADGGTLGGNAD